MPRARRPQRLGGGDAPVTIWVLGPLARTSWAAARATVRTGCFGPRRALARVARSRGCRVGTETGRLGQRCHRGRRAPWPLRRPGWTCRPGSGRSPRRLEAPTPFTSTAKSMKQYARSPSPWSGDRRLPLVDP